MLYGTECGNLYTKLHPLIGISNRLVDYAQCCADGRGREFDAADVKNIYVYAESVSRFGKHDFNRYGTVVKKQLPGRRAFNTHFMFFRVHCDPSESALNDKSSQVLIVINFGEHNKHIGKTTVSDPHFLAIDQVVGPFRIASGAGT